MLISEVANRRVPNVCFGEDFVELINTGPVAANLSGWTLYDNAGPTDNDAFTFPPQFVLAAGEVRILCRILGSFRFKINVGDVLTLSDAAGKNVSTTGVIPQTNARETYQLLRLSNTYELLGFPTPGIRYNVPAIFFNPIINEVAPAGTSSDACGGGPYIEFFNDALDPQALSDYTVQVGSLSFTLFDKEEVSAFGYATFCLPETFNGTIGSNDSVTLFNPRGRVVSSIGPMGGQNPKPNERDLVWVRVTDLVITSAPFVPFYQYSTNPTPDASNIFSFTPIQLPIQACGIQNAPLPMVSEYIFNRLRRLDVNGGDPELSGGTFDPRTCNYISVGDNGEMFEISLGQGRPNLIRARPLIGGSKSSSIYESVPDAEDVCFYRDPVNGDKLAILDEGDQSGKLLTIERHFIDFIFLI